MSGFLRHLTSRAKKGKKGNNSAVNSTAFRRPNTYSDPSFLADTTSPYTATGSNQAAENDATQNQTDDPLSFLSTFDTKFLIDDSSSMNIRLTVGGLDRWTLVSKVLTQIVPVCTKYDTDGIDIHFLNQRDQHNYSGITDPEVVDDIFRKFSPNGPTHTGHRLNKILDPYLVKCEEAKKAGREWPKPVNVIVITDGHATDDLREKLGNIGRRLDKMDADAWQVGVQFCQVGDDTRASEELAYLDDELAAESRCRDFVDTQRFDPAQGEISKDLVLKTVLGAVNKRWDRKMLG